MSALVAEALGRARDAGDRAGEGAALAQQALLLHYQAIELAPEEREAVDPAPEQELFDRSLALRLEVADVEGVAESLFGLGLVHQVLRRDALAGARYHHEAFALIETLADADTLLRSEIYRHVGFDLLVREELTEPALWHLARSLELRRTLDEPGWVVTGLVALALGERVAGRREEAVRHCREAIALARGEGLKPRFMEAAERELAAAG